MSAPDLEEAKRLMCEWLEKFYHQPNGISYQHCIIHHDSHHIF